MWKQRPRLREHSGGASQGQSLVELAISLPLVITMMMGIIDFGWVFYAHVQVAAASGAGAHSGAVFPADRSRTLGQNDADRELAVRNAIFNASSSPATSSLGLLSTSSPNFSVASDVAVSYPNGAPVDPANTIRVGEEMLVTVRYHQPVMFQVLPGTVAGRFDVSTSTRVRIQ